MVQAQVVSQGKKGNDTHAAYRAGLHAHSQWADRGDWAERVGKERGRDSQLGPACHGPEGRRGWGSGLGLVLGRDSRRGEVFFFLLNYFLSSHFQSNLKSNLNSPLGFCQKPLISINQMQRHVCTTCFYIL